MQTQLKKTIIQSDPVLRNTWQQAKEFEMLSQVINTFAEKGLLGIL